MKRGFLLMNTGSPEAPTEAAVRGYLKEFLMDPHVIDLPWPLRTMLVHGIILPHRPAKSAEAYKSIWTKNGSPLIHYCTELASKLDVELCMAYGKPSAKDAIDRLLGSGVDEACLLPLFPQSAMATTGACIAKVKAELKEHATLRIAPPFYNHPAFMTPAAESLKDVDEHILFSYHGLPLRHLKRMPPPDYRSQCMETTKAIAEASGIPEERYSVSFQSRMGKTKWTEPYTKETLRQLPARGIKHLAVVCPGFFCDCLETLEEIGIRGKGIFMETGGESFRMIPCLNDSRAAIDCVKSLMATADSWPVA